MRWAQRTVRCRPSEQPALRRRLTHTWWRSAAGPSSPDLTHTLLHLFAAAPASIGRLFCRERGRAVAQPQLPPRAASSPGPWHSTRRAPHAAGPQRGGAQRVAELPVLEGRRSNSSRPQGGARRVQGRLLVGARCGAAAGRWLGGPSRRTAPHGLAVPSPKPSCRSHALLTRTHAPICCRILRGDRPPRQPRGPLVAGGGSGGGATGSSRH